MKKYTLSLFILVVILFIASIVWWVNGTRPEDAKDTTQKLFVVAKGESGRQIGVDLKKAGLIPDQYIFYALVKLGGFDGKIQAGDFRLSPSQKPSDILSTLTKGTLDVWVTIPEGFRATEIAEKLQKSIPTYTVDWNTKLQTEEGYLFPDTYLFPKDATVEQVISIMKNNFTVKYAQAAAHTTTSYTQSEAVTLASLVEREGRSDTDMKYVASVLENRLNLGMALQVDASIQYIIGTTFTWWPQPTRADLEVISPYNTYKHAGLPPTPIANPGLTALTAVFHPADTNYLYYFTDKKGVTHFSKTLDEQNTNIAKFGL